MLRSTRKAVPCSNSGSCIELIRSRHVECQQVGGHHYLALEVGRGLVEPFLFGARCGCRYEMVENECVDTISGRSLRGVGYRRVVVEHIREAGETDLLDEIG